MRRSKRRAGEGSESGVKGNYLRSLLQEGSREPAAEFTFRETVPSFAGFNVPCVCVCVSVHKYTALLWTSPEYALCGSESLGLII